MPAPARDLPRRGNCRNIIGGRKASVSRTWSGKEAIRWGRLKKSRGMLEHTGLYAGKRKDTHPLP